VAAEWGTPEILQKVLEWAEVARITEEMYNKLLLATDNIDIDIDIDLFAFIKSHT
jgi:hypothetical protein